MKTYLALKLGGVMQAWGGHTFEDFRPTKLIPTRSGILGLLAACLGLDRGDTAGLQALSTSLHIAVRVDERAVEPQRITDFHTVMDARKVDGKSNKFPVVSRREYLCDTEYTVLLEVLPGSHWTPDQLRNALQYPVYTPFLGRRSCPPSRPLFDTLMQAIDFDSAFELIEPCAGTIYSEQKPVVSSTLLRLRDAPLYGRKRQFATRELHLYRQEVSNVSE